LQCNAGGKPEENMDSKQPQDDKNPLNAVLNEPIRIKRPDWGWVLLISIIGAALGLITLWVLLRG
jgi:hypothetical protein